MRMRLRLRLTLAFVLLAALPLLVAGAVMVKAGYDTALELQLATQRREARLAAGEVSAFVDALVRELILAVRVKGIDQLDRDGQQRLLGQLLAWENQFEELTYLDANGSEQSHIALQDGHSRAGMPHTDRQEFLAPMASRAPWFGPIEIEAETAEPLMVVAIPSLDRHGGDVVGVLVARLRLKRMWETVARLGIAADGTIYITDPAGLVVAHKNPAVVLRRVRTALPAADGRHIGIDGSPVLAARVPLVAGGRELTVVAERPLGDALSLPVDTAVATALVLGGALLAALTLVWLAGRAVIAPVQRLAGVAAAISAGDLSRRAGDTDRSDEIGELAAAFNGMTDRLRDSLATLEAKVAERTADLSQAQARLVEALESVSEGFVLCDADDRFVLCNQKFRDFYPELAYLIEPGRPYRDVIAEAARRGLSDEAAEDPDGWICRRMALRNAQAPHVQHLASGRWLLVNEQRTASGQMVAIYTDITELKSGEEALRAAKAQAETAAQAKTEFLAGMSHELRTPLNAIIGFSDTILSGVFGPLENERYREYVRDIHGSGLHLLALINDILDLSRIEAGRLVVARRPVDCAAVIERAVTMMKDLAAQGGLALETRIHPGLPPVMGDERRLLQVLLNLLSNAVKFTPEGGRVKVRAALLDDEVIVEVTDTGIGIRPDEIPRALEIFGQLDSMRSRRFPGSGLGLPLSRQLVELHDGTLGITSAPGQGTTVTVRLPVGIVAIEAPEPMACAVR